MTKAQCASEDHWSTRLAEDLNERLEKYVLAATAAGVGLLALASPAQAGIIVQPSTFTFGPGPGAYLLDIVNRGRLDFFVGTHDGEPALAILSSGSLHPVAVEVEAQPQFAAFLTKGASIGSRDVFGVSEHMVNPGYWRNQPGYLGFEYGGYFGWAHVSVTFHSNGITGKVTEFAYETDPNTSILAGQTSSTPEPATLELLALGSLGLGFWRRSKSVGSPQ